MDWASPLWARQPMASNMVNTALSHPSVRLATTQDGARNRKAWDNSSRNGGVSSNLKGSASRDSASSNRNSVALGYAAYGQALYGQGPRLLSQQDVNEVVRQILPIVPQIVGMLQGQPQLQYAALQGGSSPFGQQYGGPQFQAAFGAPINAGQQRQLTQQDVADVTRQLVGLIPQVIGNLQAYNQQRMI